MTCSPALARCPHAVDVAEGVTTVTRTARDKAGNETESDVGPLSVDLTNPVVTCDAPPTYLLNQADATVSAEVTDAGSGPVRATESVPATTSAVGRRSVSVPGSDRAGRTAADDCAYRVDYGFAGWDSPVDGGATRNVVTAGQAVPLKWRPLDAADLPVTSIGAVSLTSVAHGCTNGAVQDPLEVTAAGGSGLQNFGDGSYQPNWKTPKTYAGSCRTLRMDLGDGVHTPPSSGSRVSPVGRTIRPDAVPGATRSGAGSGGHGASWRPARARSRTHRGGRQAASTPPAPRPAYTVNLCLILPDGIATGIIDVSATVARSPPPQRRPVGRPSDVLLPQRLSALTTTSGATARGSRPTDWPIGSGSFEAEVVTSDLYRTAPRVSLPLTVVNPARLSRQPHLSSRSHTSGNGTPIHNRGRR